MSRKHNSSAPSRSYILACSTGSPASTRSTKFTPLTTRPSFTSRQGMTRIFNMESASVDHGESRGRIDASVVERPAADDPADTGLFLALQGGEVLEARDAAGRDHRRRQRKSEVDRGVQIDSAHRAVAVDIGEDD